VIATRPFILYVLTKSRTSQAFLQGNKIERIWEEITLFLNNCTTTTIEQASRITLSAYTAYSKDKQPEIADKILLQTKKIFGEGETSLIQIGYPEETRWKIEKSDLPKAIEYLSKGQPWPTFSFRPVELYIVYNFKLTDPLTKVELPHQENISSMSIYLSKRCCCITDLWFPFSEANKDFYEFINRIERYLPFKLERKYLKAGRPNKLGTQHIFKKLFPEEK